MICIDPKKSFQTIRILFLFIIYVGVYNLCILILWKETAQKGWNNGMETYHPLQMDSLLQTYCFHVFKKKRKKKTFKPIPIPKIFGILIKHWIQKKQFFIIIAYQSQNLFHYENVLEIKNKGWFLYGLKRVYYLKLKPVKISQIIWPQHLHK